jgi:hypothetical protein
MMQVMKKAILFLTLLSFLISVKFAEGQTNGKETVRPPAVAGSFYPSHPADLRNMVSGFLEEASPLNSRQPLALVVPHAGYVFSGQVAAAGFRQLDPGKSYRHIFILAPNHRVYFDGINLFTGSGFKTPLGTVPVDPLARELAAANHAISTDPMIQRQEHAIEVQLPFLQVWLKKPFSIVPILIGGEAPETTMKLAKMLEPYFNGENLFIISADFSHYPAYSNAVKADRLTASALISGNPELFLKTIRENEADYGPGLVTSICGWMPALTLMKLTGKKTGLEYREILYRNSGDSPYGDKEKVVGYWAIAVYENEKESVGQISDSRFQISDSRFQISDSRFQIPENDKVELLKLARTTIEHYLRTGIIGEPDPSDITPAMKSKSGAFVTLMKNGELRGCIGQFISDQPLYRTIQEMAIAAATRDNRFTPVTPPEMLQIDLEISVLTPLKRIFSVSEFHLGRDGIYMKKGGRSGTFLPQVAEQTSWSTEEFLGHCARDKAFIGWDGWKDKDTELYTYQAMIFKELELKSEPTRKNK